MLSTTEAEYIALPSALHEVITIMNLLMEMKEHEFPMHASVPHVKNKVFVDNHS